MQAVPLSPQPSFQVGGSRSGGQWQVGGGPLCLSRVHSLCIIWVVMPSCLQDVFSFIF